MELRENTERAEAVCRGGRGGRGGVRGMERRGEGREDGFTGKRGGVQPKSDFALGDASGTPPPVRLLPYGYLIDFSNQNIIKGMVQASNFTRALKSRNKKERKKFRQLINRLIGQSITGPSSHNRFPEIGRDVPQGHSSHQDRNFPPPPTLPSPLPSHPLSLP